MTFQHPQILELAHKIPKLTELIVEYLEARNLPNPSYDPQYRAPETPEFEALLAPLNEATQDLARLVNGPIRYLTSIMLAHYDLAAYQAALEFGVFEVVPLGAGESILLKNLAAKVKLDEDRTRRITKLLTTQRIFVEAESDVFEHTSVSASIARDEQLRAAALMQSV